LGAGVASAGVGSGGGNVVVQSRVVGLRLPVRMTWPWYQTVATSFLNTTSHPASQSCPMERRLVLPREGKMWAVLAERGKLEMLIAAVWVD
jgi:hypothetical protein